MGRKYIDLTNTTMENGLYVKELVPGTGGAGKHKKWICVCPICKKEFISQSNHIIGDKIASCSTCGRKKFNDLTGQKFGLLTVKERLFERTDGTKYLCICECGNTHIADGRGLKAGTVKSCGCLKSSMEYKIKQILSQNNIKFETQKFFKDCKDERMLPFDFYIPDLNILIEAQGEQHFHETNYFGGMEKFITLIRHDLIKEDYCKINNIKLIQIAYYEDLNKIINEEIVWPLRKQKE